MIRIRIVAKTLQAVPVILALALSGCFEDSGTPARAKCSSEDRAPA